MALSSSDGALEEALKTLNCIPPDVNPYSVLHESLWLALVPELPHSFIVQLYALSGVFALCFILVATSMILQAAAGNFWLVRSRNGLWRPHWSLGWSTFALLLLLFLQVQVWTEWLWSRRTLVFGLIDFKLLPWIFSWIGGSVACWSLVTSSMLNSSSTATLSRPLVLTSNTMSVLVPAIFLGALLPFWIKASISYRAFLANFDSLLTAMEAKSAAFTGIWSVVDFMPFGDLLDDMQDHLDVALFESRRVFIVLAACTTGLVTALITISAIQLSALTVALSRTKQLVSTLESSSSRDKALLRSYHNLKWTIISFSSIGLCFIGICSYVAIRPRQSFTLKRPIQVTTLLPLYNIAVFGLPTAILLFTLSVEGWKLQRAGGVAGSVGVSGSAGAAVAASGVKSGTSSYSGPDTSSWHQKLKKGKKSKNGSGSGGNGAQSLSILCAGGTLSQLNSPLTPAQPEAFELDAFTSFERRVTFPADDGPLDDVKV
ncbi:hypothetical protein ACM66B_003457 [Microbotryomycetes sp. NB124-2]